MRTHTHTHACLCARVLVCRQVQPCLERVEARTMVIAGGLDLVLPSAEEAANLKKTMPRAFPVVRVCAHVCVRACACVCMHACVRGLHACVCLCLHACMCERLACVRASVPCLPTPQPNKCTPITTCRCCPTLATPSFPTPKSTCCS